MFSVDQLANVVNIYNDAIVEKEGIDCDFLITRTFDVFMDEQQAQEQEEIVKSLYDANIGKMHSIVN